MKKKIYMTLATLLCVASVGGQSLTANAAPLSKGNITQQGNRVIITNMGNCNVSTLLESILQQLPGCKPIQPECNVPGTNCPDNNCPDSNCPDTNLPEQNAPGIQPPEAEKPDTQKPETNIPDTETPDAEVPDTETPDTEAPDTETPENGGYHRYVQQIVDLVNAEREKAGLAPLTLDKKVTAAAQVRAEEIRQSFSHTRPNGSNFSTALKEQNVSYRRSGENIAWGQPSPEAVVNAWMNSSGHRANILNKNFTKIGVGYFQYNGRNYWSQLFVG